ncbi:RidA family protein [Sphingomonas flavalba]|uniref:RidA family protein n=1 Tax=Sphingomonas flavalba TaxID=2559804 RepID=UPI0019D174F9|nr:RidA family protein [Sphingomonas flavalba]
MILCPGATPPHGHYAHATVHDGTVYVSGILGNGAGVAGVPPPIEAQAAYCLDQIALILAEAGSALDHVLKLSVHVADLGDWPRIDALCGQRFGAHRPARIVVPCADGLRLGSRVEMDAIAACVTDAG